MKCVLVNENFDNNFVENLIRARDGDPQKVLYPTVSALNDPELLCNIELAAHMYIELLRNVNTKKFALIVD